MAQAKTQPTSRGQETPTPKYLWHSGRLVEWEKATVHVTAVGWTAISAVFEGIRAYWDPNRQELYLFHLDAHLKRVAQSMKLMRMAQTFTPAQVRDAILDLLRANDFREDVYVQPLVYFAEGVPGYLSVVDRPVDVLITASSDGRTLYIWSFGDWNLEERRLPVFQRVVRAR